MALSPPPSGSLQREVSRWGKGWLKRLVRVNRRQSSVGEAHNGAGLHAVDTLETERREQRGTQSRSAHGRRSLSLTRKAYLKNPLN